MVKAEGMSNRNNAPGSDESNTSSILRSASPSSPPRRLKKGGKRRHRLCYKEGCMLCPSFGYEGSFAVSCSRHKEEGMRNLTARRCQLMGCFTAANFGMPGDKPRFCLAHSTEGMVSWNKPRERKDALITVARSSRRITKANGGVYVGNSANGKASGMMEVAPVAEAPVRRWHSEVGNCPVSRGENTLMREKWARFGVNGRDHCPPLLSRPLTNARPRGAGSSAVTVGDTVASVVNDRPVSSMAFTTRGHRSGVVMSQKHSSCPMTTSISMPPWESGSGFGISCTTESKVFVSRGDGLDGPSAKGREEKPSGGIVGVPSERNGQRVCLGNVEQDPGPATVPRIHSCRNKCNVSPSVKMEDLKNHLPSNERDVFGGIVDRSVRNTSFDLSFAEDVGNSGDINGSHPSFFMDMLNSLGDSDKVDSNVGVHIGATLEEILGVKRDDVKMDVLHSTRSHKQEPCLGGCPDPSALDKCRLRSISNNGAMQSSVGLSLDGCLPALDSVIDVEEARSGSNCIANEIRGNRFGMDHLSELDSAFISERYREHFGQDTKQQQKQGHYLCSGVGNYNNDSSEVTISSGLRGEAYASPIPSSTSKMALDIANKSLVETAVHSTLTSVTPTQAPATLRGMPTVPGIPEAFDEGTASCYHLEENDFTVPEPVWGPMWGPMAEGQGLASAGDVIKDSIYHDHDNLGRGDNDGKAGDGNEVALGVSAVVGISLIACRVNGGGGNGGESGGGACLSPPQKRRRYSLGGKCYRLALALS